MSLIKTGKTVDVKDQVLTVSASHSSVVIGHRDQIVNRRAVVGIDDVGRHVQTPGGKFHVRVQLVTPVAIVREPLQADDQQGREGPKVEFLRCLLVLLAFGAVPGR